MKGGFNAGDGYREVWIRDYNTFLELAAQVFPKEELKENLLVFCRMQGEDGNREDIKNNSCLNLFLFPKCTIFDA
jgi:hypothetical protein